MRPKTFTSLSVLLLFAVITVPTVRSQGNNKTKKAEATASALEQTSKEVAKADWSKSEPPRDGEEWFARGYQMHNSDRFEEAIEAFKRAADLGHRKATAMYNIACGYSLLNDKENALVWLQQALDNGFEGADYLWDDSDLDPLRSDSRFKQILASVPRNDEAERKNAKRYGSADRLEQANLDYARLQSDASATGEDWARVGMSLLMLRDLDRSIIALKRAIAGTPDYEASSAMYNLACAYSLQGNRELGVEWLAKSVNAGFDGPEKLRNDPDIKRLRTDSRFASIDKLSNTLSLSQFNEASLNDKRDLPVRHWTNYSKERWAPAITLYESFLKDEPNNGRAWFNLGYALHFSREHTRANSAFERAISLGYHEPVATYNIACGYAMLNQKDPAFEWLDRAFKAGFDANGTLQEDDDLNNLRSDPRFRRFAEASAHSKKERSLKEKRERSEW
ncbi:MAG TPA: tetratricopeptide repeat protein [Pyrinomonadaceae bacterium]|jgi:tetratricopeptide (TPR) repeat protein|nr:tetratricopeptide repeat protein [Pyrinomonadaceae bacterium]